MGPALVFVIPLIFFGMGGGILYMMNKSLKVKKMIESTQKVDIRLKQKGLVKFEGKPEPGEDGLVTTPISGEKCFYYRYWVEQYKGSDKDGHKRFQNIAKGEGGGLFYLKDKTGKVLVYPADAEFFLTKGSTKYSGIGNEPESKLKQFLDDIGVKHDGIIFNKNLKYTDTYIAKDDNLLIIGSSMGDTPKDPVKKDFDSDNFLIISAIPEAEVLKRFSTRVVWTAIIGGIFVFAGLFTTLLFAFGLTGA